MRKAIAQPATDDQSWTVHDVARLLNVPIGALYRWRYLGYGEPSTGRVTAPVPRPLQDEGRSAVSDRSRPAERPSGATALVDKLLLSPEEVAEALSVSRSKVYELLASGRLDSVKIGRCRRVVQSVLLRFVDELQEAR
jgi:excisionase family DNA binding protein